MSSRAMAVEEAVAKAQEHLFRLQHQDGSFFADVYFNVYANSSYVILLDYLGIEHPRKAAIIDWITSHQNTDGSWGDIVDVSPGNYQFTRIAYIAAKEYLAEQQRRKAEQWLSRYSGPKWIDPYTRLSISMKEDIVLMSPPYCIFFILKPMQRLLGKLHMLFPRLFYWSVLFYPSTWTRNASLSLIVNDQLRRPRSVARKLVLKVFEKKLRDAQLENGSWYDLGRTTRGSIYALSQLGYSLNDACISRALCFLSDRIGVKGNLNGLRLTVWDTSLALLSVTEGSASSKHTDRLEKAKSYLLACRSRSGAWPFSFYMRDLTDNDDTALAITALYRYSTLISKIPSIQDILAKGERYLLRRQNDDGGWAAFLKNQCYKSPGIIPPFHKDRGHELKDPSTADVTAHVIQMFGELNRAGHHREAIEKAVGFLRRDQLAQGCWWGRWGVCYIYATTQVLSAMRSIGTDRKCPMVRRGLDWLIACQNPDGGWGEEYSSYYSAEPILGSSTIEHTSWAVSTLLDYYSPMELIQIQKGIGYLLDSQNADGSFPASFSFAAIEPGKHDMYSVVFPLQALNKYRKAYVNGSN